MPKIYEYSDYRKFMEDFLREKQAVNPGFSLRAFAQKLAITPGFLTRVLKGQRNISGPICLHVARTCHLTKKETEFFELLVQYNQAQDIEQRKTYFERLRSYAGSKIRQLTSAQYDFYGTWYNTVVREILHIEPFKGDHAALAKRLVPRITPAEAKNAIALLERLGLVEKKPDGTWEPTDSLISTGYGAHALAVYNFQQEMLRLAHEGYARFTTDERSYSTLTISISKEDFQEVIEELRAFRKRVLEISAKRPASGRVYQLNFQIFPVSENLTAKG